MDQNDSAEFFNLYRHGFIRSAVCVPTVKVADPRFNADQTILLAREAAAGNAIFALFPELGISAYSNDDLFHQEALLSGVRGAIERIARETAPLNLILVIGAPLRVDSRLFNCGVVLYRGRIIGVAVKSYLPNYREFYEGRQFSPAEEAIAKTIRLCGQEGIPFGADLIFEVTNVRHFRFFLEMCEDVWVPIPPSCFASLAGATVIGNLSASNATIGKAEYRQSLTANQSARCISAYLYAAAGPGESTTDLAWDGHAMIYENGNLLAESRRFANNSQIIRADIDLDRLVQDRMRQTSFGANARTHRETLVKFRRVAFEIEPVGGRLLLEREYARFPYIPADPATRRPTLL